MVRHDVNNRWVTTFSERELGLPTTATSVVIDELTQVDVVPDCVTLRTRISIDVSMTTTASVLFKTFNALTFVDRANAMYESCGCQTVEVSTTIAVSRRLIDVNCGI